MFLYTSENDLQTSHLQMKWRKPTSLTLRSCNHLESGENEAPSFLVQPVFHGRNPAGSLSTDSVSSLVDVEQLSTVEEVAKALIEFLVTR